MTRISQLLSKKYLSNMPDFVSVFASNYCKKVKEILVAVIARKKLI